jgi:hypothetical protein
VIHSKIAFLILLTSLSFSILAQDPSTNLTDEQLLSDFQEVISAEKLFSHVEILSSEKFEGRLTGHKGFDKSAKWVTKKFSKWGIEPLGENGTFLQKFPHPYTDVFPGWELSLIRDSADIQVKKSYRYVEDYIPGSTSGNGEVTAEVVYVGYGITAPELGYDDYAGLDVKGKIVVFDRELPVKTSHDDFLQWRPYSFHQYKLHNAVKHGAAGMLYNYHIANPNNDFAEGFIYAHVGKNVMEDLFNGTVKKHEEIVLQISETVKPLSFNTGKKVTLKANTKHHPNSIGSNVIGFIEGSDPVLKNEYIMVGGHLDHLGNCYTMMPGAHDNASAVSVTMGIAEALSKSEVKLKRSVVFVLLGAEEAALKGVQYFLKNPTVSSLDQIKGYINMDGVGIGDKIHVSFAENYPGFYSYLDDTNKKLFNHELSGGYVSNISRPRLDAAFFDWYGIPVLSIYTKGDAEAFSNYRYHTPYDNITNIDAEIMEDLAELLFISIVRIANEETLSISRGQIKQQFIK